MVLDVNASGGASLAGTWTDGIRPRSFSVHAISPTFESGLSGSYPSGGGPISLSTTNGPLTTRALDLVATSGTLSGGSSAAPYERTTVDTSTRWSAESNVPVTIDGRVTLDVYAGDQTSIEATIRDSDSNPFEIRVSGTSRFLSGSYDFDGGPITIRSTADPIAMKGMTLRATAGSLSGGGDPAPFETLSVNTASQWSVNSNAFVMFDGNVVLDVVASFGSTIQGEYSDGRNDQQFELTRSAPQFTGNLVGSFPFEGGPVTIKSVREPVVTRRLDLTATKGRLISGGSPAPYQSLTNNSVSRWTANSNTDVTIDGTVELDLIASAGTEFDSMVWDGTTTNRFRVFPSLPAVTDTRLVGSFPVEGGISRLLPRRGQFEPVAFHLLPIREN